MFEQYLVGNNSSLASFGGSGQGSGCFFFHPEIHIKIFSKKNFSTNTSEWKLKYTINSKLNSHTVSQPLRSRTDIKEKDCNQI